MLFDSNELLTSIPGRIFILYLILLIGERLADDVKLHSNLHTYSDHALGLICYSICLSFPTYQFPNAAIVFRKKTRNLPPPLPGCFVVVPFQVAVFALLKELVMVLPNGLTDHIGSLLPYVERALSVRPIRIHRVGLGRRIPKRLLLVASVSLLLFCASLHFPEFPCVRTPTFVSYQDKSSNSNLKIEALLFLRLAMASHPPTVFQQHISVWGGGRGSLFSMLSIWCHFFLGGCFRWRSRHCSCAQGRTSAPKAHVNSHLFRFMTQNLLRVR